MQTKAAGSSLIGSNDVDEVYLNTTSSVKQECKEVARTATPERNRWGEAENTCLEMKENQTPPAVGRKD